MEGRGGGGDVGVKGQGRGGAGTVAKRGGARVGGGGGSGGRKIGKRTGQWRAQ